MDDNNTTNRTQSVPVGHVFFGQFVDHDITLDVFSSFDRVNSANAIGNSRTPTLDLDCIFGPNHETAGFMYQSEGTFADVKLLTGEDQDPSSETARNDLLRSVNTRAIIGDHRNDENRIISQIQLAMIRFYNNMCDRLHADGLEGGELREAAQQQTCWQYQWVVVNDFLKAICGGAVIDDILASGRKFYCDGIPYIPVEFSVAAYRFGHSMVPGKIQVQKGESSFALFGDILGDAFSPLLDRRAIVDWHELFDNDNGRIVQMADKMDTKLASILLNLPFVGDDDEASLATRNLLRGNSFLLPGGDIVAAHMNRPEAEVNRVLELVSEASDGKISQGIPLWFYILAEAEIIGRETTVGVFDTGEGLGPVGARIVAETIIGLLEYDESSYLGVNRNWKPIVEFDTVGKILASTNSTDL